MSNVAQTIYQQLGANKFRAMTGAKDFVALEKGLMFRIPKAKQGINKIIITLNDKDLYDVDFYRIRSLKPTLINRSENIYFDQLQQIFTDNTGLYTHL